LSLISIGQLADDGCHAVFTKNTVTIYKDDQVILAGTRDATTANLWQINLDRPTGSAIPGSNYACNVVEPHNIRDRVAFVSATLGNPTVSTLCKALDNGHLTTFPAITSKQVRKFPPTSTASAKGIWIRRARTSVQPKSILQTPLLTRLNKPMRV